MGLLDIIKKAGHGIVQGVDNAAYNSLGGGLLGSAIPQPVGGLLGPTPMSNSTNDDGSPVDPSVQPSMSPVAPVSQQFKPNPAQTRNMRSDFLMSIGSALQQHRPLAEGIQNYQQGVVGQLQAGQAAQQAQAKQQATTAFQREMQAAAGNLPAQQQVLMKYSTVLGPAETKAYQDVIKGMQPDNGETVPVGDRGYLNKKTGVYTPLAKPEKVLSPEDQAWPELVKKNNGDISAALAELTAIMHPKEPPQPRAYGLADAALESAGINPSDPATHTPANLKRFIDILKPPKVDPPTINVTPALPDGTVNPMVQSIANYDTNLVTPRGGSPQAMKIYEDTIKAVKTLNPSWDMKNYQTAQRTLNAFNSGKEAQSVNAINTVAGHLNSLSDAATALGGGNITVLNKIANEFGLQTGSQPLAVYNTIVHRIGPEITKAYVGTGGEASDRKANEGDFSASLGPQRIQANIGATASLFKSKMNALGHQFEQGVKGRKFDGFITPEAQATFDRFSPVAQPTLPSAGGWKVIGVK